MCKWKLVFAFCDLRAYLASTSTSTYFSLTRRFYVDVMHVVFHSGQAAKQKYLSLHEKVEC